MKLYKTVALLFTSIIITASNAQFFPAKNYPQGYFMWPVKATKAINANFGELRPNHYHMGLDCKTEKKQNLPVVAAADGYIAKVKIEPYGFGRAIYINHPNGYTTLYAHLNEFYPELEAYVKEQQYKLQTWRIFLDVPPNLFPVQKGMFIAASGNTGGSQGPHLHFEIRDTKTDKVLNPLLFNFGLIDNAPPTVTRLAMYDRCLSTYEQAPKFLPLKKVAGTYTIPQTIITNTDKVSFAIGAFDTYTGSTNQNGIYGAEVYDNEKPIVGFEMDNIDYDETRYLNAHIDYKMKANGGPYLQHLSRLSGFNNSLYKMVNGDGVIMLDDDSVHNIRVVVKDANGNTSQIKFAVKRGQVVEKPGIDSLLSMQKKFYPGYVNVFDNNKINFYLPETALYDSIRFRYSEVVAAYGNPIFQLHYANVPVHTNFPIKIKPVTAVPDKMVMYRFAGSKKDFKKAVQENGWYKASFREFGNFQLVVDTQPPTVTPIGIKDGMNATKASRIAFIIKDNTDDIEKFTATLDGEWLRFTNDKGRTFAYVFDEKCPPGAHVLKIVVEDMAGNLTEKVYNFTR
jgi:hypothetical protein